MNPFEEQDYTKQFDIRLWGRIFKLCKNERTRLVKLAVLLILLASGEAAFPLMNRYAIDNYATGQRLGTLPFFLAAYACLVAGMGLVIYLFILICGKVEAGVVYHIRKTGFRKLQELPFSYYDTTPVGWIMARMTSDAQRIGDVVAWSSIDIVWGSAMIAFITVSMFVLNVKLALVTVCMFPVLMAVSFFFQRIILKNHREIRKYNSKITGAYNEGINGARTTKSLNRESKNFEEFETLTFSMKSMSVRAAVISSVYLPIVMGLGSVGVALVLWQGGHDALGGAVSIGTYAVFITYAMQIYDPVHQIARVFSEFNAAQASAERTLSLIEQEPEITDSDEVVKLYGDSFNPVKENWPEIKGEIEFENVGFVYKTGERVLENFSLRVPAGQRIALVGETGAGKSTIINLICRFYEPTEGRVLIDGTDYKKRSQLWLQSNVGYVLQTPHLFSGTVAENIRYAKRDATPAEIMEAAGTVGALEFISKLEKGFDTEVGEGGSRLSSGQRQLVSFARAIIADPRLFVLDEATSSVDTETESTIQKAVDSVLHGRTSFIVAHRLSTIRSCDRIIVIRDGEIIEDGNHKTLLKQKGAYYNLYANQFKSEAERELLAR